MRAFDVFTPTGVPTITYVEREDRELERRLRDAIRTPGMIASLSGPSKSGKTVLIKKVIDQELLITVSGAALVEASTLWERVLNWMEAPSQTTRSTTNTYGVEGSAKASGGINALIAKAQGEASAGASFDHQRGAERVFERGGIDQVVRDLANSEFVLFIDDYHYMPREVQMVVARQIKEAAERGVNVCTASVPHRADDVVRSNAELRGRVQNIDFAYWTAEEIKEIARRGFAALEADIRAGAIDAMAAEAFGSPQLMQQICLQSCLRLDIEEGRQGGRMIPVTEADLNKIFEQASTTTDFSSLLEGFHNGPKQRGTTRNQFDFRDGSSGDVYRCVLLALRESPPLLSFPYEEIYERTRSVCTGEAPAGSSVASALEQLPTIAAEIEPFAQVIEWSDDVLDIVDPYFLYYLRCSSRLQALAKV